MVYSRLSQKLNSLANMPMSAETGIKLAKTRFRVARYFNRDYTRWHNKQATHMYNDTQNGTRSTANDNHAVAQSSSCLRTFVWKWCQSWWRKWWPCRVVPPDRCDLRQEANQCAGYTCIVIVTLWCIHDCTSYVEMLCTTYGINWMDLCGKKTNKQTKEQQHKNV